MHRFPRISLSYTLRGNRLDIQRLSIFIQPLPPSYGRLLLIDDLRDNSGENAVDWGGTGGGAESSQIASWQLGGEAGLTNSRKVPLGGELLVSIQISPISRWRGAR